MWLNSKGQGNVASMEVSGNWSEEDEEITTLTPKLQTRSHRKERYRTYVSLEKWLILGWKVENTVVKVDLKVNKAELGKRPTTPLRKTSAPASINERQRLKCPFRQAIIRGVSSPSGVRSKHHLLESRSLRCWRKCERRWGTHERWFNVRAIKSGVRPI